MRAQHEARGKKDITHTRLQAHTYTRIIIKGVGYNFKERLYNYCLKQNVMRLMRKIVKIIVWENVLFGAIELCANCVEFIFVLA